MRNSISKEEEIVAAETDESTSYSDTSALQSPLGASSDYLRVAAEVPEKYRLQVFHASHLPSVVVAVVIAMLVLKMATPGSVRPKVWTLEELAKCNGSDDSRPLLLSILGSVFDVSKGETHYGPDGPYHHFTGRDASRAFASGNFTEGGLISSLQGLTALQVKGIDDWKTFFEKKYIYRGTLIGPFYDELGKPKKELTKVARKLEIAAKIIQQQKDDETRFPTCNSRWTPAEGGKVWCNKGHPRIIDMVSKGTYKGTTGSRCACFERSYLNKKGLRSYDRCPPKATICQSSPPEL